MAFDWDQANIDHIARHGLTPAEAEYALIYGNPVLLGVQESGDERRYLVVARMESQILQVFIYTLRSGKIRPITTFPANTKRQKAYLERSEE